MQDTQDNITWTSTQGSELDSRFFPKLIRYKGILYQCFPLNHEAEISPRSHEFCYLEVEKRILRDETLIQETFSRLEYINKLDLTHLITKQKINELDPYWENGFFNGADARFGYSMIVDRKPSKVLEIGAGNSTKFFRRAIKDFGLATKLMAIDPAPRSDISQICDEIFNSSVFHVDLDFFNCLNSGDILFWDGSHVVSNGSDATRLFLEILPRLQKGVLVHIHDITMPYEAARIAGAAVSFPENYLLGTYILNNPQIKITLPVHYLSRIGKIDSWGGSFWFEV